MLTSALNINKILGYVSTITHIFSAKRYFKIALKVAITATLSNTFMISGFITAVKGIQALTTVSVLEIYHYSIPTQNLYLPCAFLVFLFFSLSGELKYKQEKHIEHFKSSARSNVLEAMIKSIESPQQISSTIPENAVFYSQDPAHRMKAFSSINNVVHRASLGLSNIIPSLIMMVLVAIVMYAISFWLTLLITIGALPIFLYLTLSISKSDSNKQKDAQILAKYNSGIKKYFNSTATSKELRSVIYNEYEKSSNLRMNVCKREYIQSYWANASLFATVAIGLYMFNKGHIDIPRLILYVLSLRWFISSTIRTLNNAHTIGLSRDGCFYINWAEEIYLNEKNV